MKTKRKSTSEIGFPCSTLACISLRHFMTAILVPWLQFPKSDHVLDLFTRDLKKNTRISHGLLSRYVVVVRRKAVLEIVQQLGNPGHPQAAAEASSSYYCCCWLLVAGPLFRPRLHFLRTLKCVNVVCHCFCCSGRAALGMEGSHYDSAENSSSLRWL